MRSTASRSCAPQSHRWLPNTSPVRHSLWGRTSGTDALSADVTPAARSPSAKARCSWPSTSPSKLNTRAAVAKPSANRSGTDTWVRMVAAGSRGIRAASAGLKARGHGVAQKDHIADLADLGERRAAARVPGEAAVPHEPGGPRVAHEERRDDQLQLVDEVVGEELGVHRAAALD